MSFRSVFPMQSKLIEGKGITPVWQRLLMSLYTTLGGASGQVVFGPSSIKPTRTNTLSLGDTSVKLKNFKLNGNHTQSGVVVSASLTESGLSSNPFSAGISYKSGDLMKTVNSTIPSGWEAVDESIQGRAVAASGSGSGLTPRDTGDSVGEYTHTTTEAEMATHEHTIPERSNDPNLTSFKLENYGTYNLNGRFLESTSEVMTTSAYTPTPRNNTQASVFYQYIIKL